MTLNNNRIIYILAVLLISALFTSCNRATQANGSVNTPENGVVSPSTAVSVGETAGDTDTAMKTLEPVYFSLPDKIMQVDSMSVYGNQVYFTAEHEYSANPNASTEETARVFYTKLYVINTDGTGLTEVEKYKPMSVDESKSKEMLISAMCTDSSNNIWLIECDTYLVEENPHVFLRKLDKDGTELLHTDISSVVQADGDFLLVHQIEADNEGRIYIADDFSAYVFDTQGNELFSAPLPEGHSYRISLIRTNRGAVGTLTTEDGFKKIKILDPDTRSWSKEYIYSISLGAYSGTGEYTFLYNDGTWFCGYVTETGERKKLINLNEYTKGRDINTLVPLDENNVICALDEGYGSGTELVIIPLIPTPVDNE